MDIALVEYILAFISIWYGAGLIISSVESLSGKIHASRFLLSFLLLGMLTSIPEIAVGLTSVVEQKPEIFVGDLLGGIAVLFLFVTPILAVFGNGITIDHGLHRSGLIATLGVILTPSLFVLDGTVSNYEAGIMIGLYGLLVFYLKKYLSFDKDRKKTKNKELTTARIVFQVIVGVILVFASSHVIVETTLMIAVQLHVSAFYISLIGVAIGTNLPELSIALRAILQKKKDIAFGDYMGSAAVNTLLFGIFSLLIDGHTYNVQNYTIEFVVLSVGLVLFYYFSQSKQIISRKEGFVLLCVFVIFCILGYR